MATCARCLIWRSSSRRGDEVWFLLAGIASTTAAALLGALIQTASTHGDKVMGDDAPANVSFKSDLAFIKGSPHAKAVFERAHARFNACSPALATAEPTLFLSRRPAGAQAAAGRQNHLLDPQLEASLFVGAVPEASVSSSQSGCLTE